MEFISRVSAVVMSVYLLLDGEAYAVSFCPACSFSFHGVILKGGRVLPIFSAFSTGARSIVWHSSSNAVRLAVGKYWVSLTVAVDSHPFAQSCARAASTSSSVILYVGRLIALTMKCETLPCCDSVAAVRGHTVACKSTDFGCNGGIV